MRGLAGVDAGTTAIVSQLGLSGPSVRVTVQVSNPGPICAGHRTGQFPETQICGSLQYVHVSYMRTNCASQCTCQ